jgi:hypothetical protein
MVAPHCSAILAAYRNHLVERFEMLEEDGACRLLTPFYLPDNTQLTVGVIQQEDGSFEVTDFGETDDFLYLSGLTIPKEDQRLVRAGNRFGVDATSGEIRKFASVAELPDAIDDVIHAILDVSYLVYTKQTPKPPTFTAEIDKLFSDEVGIRYKQGAVVRGKTNEHTFDFSLTSAQASFLIDSISSNDSSYAKDRAQLIAYAADDVRSVLPNAYQFVCFLDDRTNETKTAITLNVLSPLEEHGIQIIRWSDRKPARELLLAAA